MASESFARQTGAARLLPEGCGLAGEPAVTADMRSPFLQFTKYKEHNALAVLVPVRISVASVEKDSIKRKGKGRKGQYYLPAELLLGFGFCFAFLQKHL